MSCMRLSKMIITPALNLGDYYGSIFQVAAANLSLSLRVKALDWFVQDTKRAIEFSKLVAGY